MPVTLQEAKVGMADRVVQGVIDMFQRESLLLDRLTFDDSISPGTGGSTMTYGYLQLQTPSMANVREINNEYTPGEAKVVEKTAKAIIMGGSFEVDRVIQNTSGVRDEIEFQFTQKIIATRNQFHNLVINGTKAASGSGYVVNTFDGLRKMLAGTDREITSDVDLSSASATKEDCFAFLDELDALVYSVDGCDMLLMNGSMLLKARSAARYAGYYERNEDAFGRVVETYNGIPMVDLGKYYNGNAKVDVVPTTNGKSSIFAVGLGLDGFHGISPAGGKIIHAYRPDMQEPGAVKKGEVELVAGVVLKNMLKAACLKDVTISA